MKQIFTVLLGLFAISGMAIDVPSAPVPKPKATKSEKDLADDKRYQAYVQELQTYIDAQNVRDWYFNNRNVDLVSQIEIWKKTHPKLSVTQMALALVLLESRNIRAHHVLDGDICSVANYFARQAAKEKNRSGVLVWDTSVGVQGGAWTTWLGSAKIETSILKAAKDCNMSRLSDREAIQDGRFCADMVENDGYFYCVAATRR